LPSRAPKSYPNPAMPMSSSLFGWWRCKS
jgi:hypothetical protein